MFFYANSFQDCNCFGLWLIAWYNKLRTSGQIYRYNSISYRSQPYYARSTLAACLDHETCLETIEEIYRGHLNH